jgi:hypothetical protein
VNAITAKATGDGLAVELNLDAALPAFFDLIADAFDDDPEVVAGLLVDLAQTRRKLHRAQEQVERGIVPDHVAENFGAKVDWLHQSLEEQLGSHVAVTLTYGEARAAEQQLADAASGTFFGRVGRAS